MSIQQVNPDANAGGSTRAQLGGNFTVNADSLSATSGSTNTATTGLLAFQASFFDLNVPSGPYTSHETEAITTPQAHLTVNGGGLTLDAHSVSTATIDQIDALDLSAIDISLVESTAEAGGKTNAFIDEGATLDADAINVTADSNNSGENQ